MKTKELRQILSMPTVELFDSLSGRFQRMGMRPTVGIVSPPTLKWFRKGKGDKAQDPVPGYLYVPGTLPALLVAHADTTHDPRGGPIDVFFDASAGVFFSPDGLGADDRAGVAAILEIVRMGFRPHVLITNGEERGGWGARAFVDSKIDLPIHCIIGLDRRGWGDAVFYGCGNQEWKEHVVKVTSNKEATGSFSDTSVLGPAMDRAAVNLSIGFWDEHQGHETMRMWAWRRGVHAARDLLSNLPVKPLLYMPVAVALTYKDIDLGGKSALWYYDEDDMGIGTTMRTRSALCPLPSTGDEAAHEADPDLGGHSMVCPRCGNSVLWRDLILGSGGRVTCPLCFQSIIEGDEWTGSVTCAACYDTVPEDVARFACGECIARFAPAVLDAATVGDVSAPACDICNRLVDATVAFCETCFDALADSVPWQGAMNAGQRKRGAILGEY